MSSFNDGVIDDLAVIKSLAETMLKECKAAGVKLPAAIRLERELRRQGEYYAQFR